LVGVLALLFVYAILLKRIFKIGRLAELKDNLFGAFVCYGIGILFSLQAFINIGVNTGLLPTKGLTLPFISAGGTSLVVCIGLIAIVNRVYGETLQMAARGTK
jgi:cell division protein FtsW